MNEETIAYGTARCGHVGQIFRTGLCAHCHIASLEVAARKFRDAFTYDPGHSDLDNEQPIHVTVTLGDWRMLNRALS